eukprot:c9143_g1_i1 orf=133-2313(+)
MLPSKAERILSRYRPIAPKPLPLPPSGSYGTTDPSSTCASLDSFTSSAKCKKSRKRRADDLASGKGLRSAKPMGSGLSNTAGASSLTQGGSDGKVPLRDMRSASQISHGTMAFGLEDGAEMSNGTTRDVRVMHSDVRYAAYAGSVAAPLYVSDAGNLVQQQGVYMSAEANSHQQQFSILHHELTPGYNPWSGGLMEKDAGFMERAAAASATVPPDRSTSLPVCDVACGKGVGYGGGGFTEMIRGITRLPTVADVQSLMQARASPFAASLPAVPGGSGGGIRSSPSRSKDHVPLSPSRSRNLIVRSPPLTDQVDQVCESNAELITLSLFPNVPSKACSQVNVPLLDPSPSAQLSLHGPSHNAEPSWRKQVSQKLEPTAVLASRSPDLSHTGVQLASGIPLFSLPAKRAAGGTMSPPSLGVPASPVMADGTVINEVYLEQVYGGSTDPVLLVDDSNQVLWFNKPYDRALKSSTERLSGKTMSTGPYIDPLGHPTPLGRFVLPVYGKSSRATLWGFLRKLVIQENELPLEQHVPSPSSQLRLNAGEASQSSLASMEPIGRMNSVACAGNSRLITVTLESITELHMDVPAAVELVEAAEAQLGAGSEPAFITDFLSRVRWVNAALKQMLGHMNSQGSRTCSGVSGNSGADVAMSNSPEAWAFVICCTEKIPRSAWAFSCRVNFEWMKGTKRRSMTVPCDVSRLACTPRSSEVNWVWQLDMAVSLCLNAPS